MPLPDDTAERFEVSAGRYALLDASRVHALPREDIEYEAAKLVNIAKIQHHPPVSKTANQRV